MATREDLIATIRNIAIEAGYDRELAAIMLENNAPQGVDLEALLEEIYPIAEEISTRDA